MPKFTMTLELDESQLNVLLCQIECMFQFQEEERGIAEMNRQLDRCAEKFVPGDPDQFESPIVRIAPVYVQMMRYAQEHRVPEPGFEDYDNLFEFVSSLREARAWCVT